MRRSWRFVSTLAAVAAAALSTPAWQAHAAETDGDGGGGRAVFVQTNDPGANSIVAYRRNADGTLAKAATYQTGGKGGRTLGSGADPLASQGSLVYDPVHSLLLAVNAGSDTVSVFSVDGARLDLNQVISSGGPFPVSISVHGNLVYVLDAGLTGDVSGYRIAGGLLHPISQSTRSLGLANSDPPFFLASPAQIGFAPDGGQLVVTTKTGNTVDLFDVESRGRLSSQPVKNPEAGVPFAFVFDPAERLVLVNAATSSVGAFDVNRDGSITPEGAQVTDAQAAACWIVTAGGFDYVANAGSGTISQYRVGQDGTVVLVKPVAAAAIPGAIDMATANHSRFLYAQSGGSGAVDAFAVSANGSLTLIQSLAVPDGANQEGIAAT